MISLLTLSKKHVGIKVKIRGGKELFVLWVVKNKVKLRSIDLEMKLKKL